MTFWSALWGEMSNFQTPLYCPTQMCNQERQTLMLCFHWEFKTPVISQRNWAQPVCLMKIGLACALAHLLIISP